jgi:hypothetical protein
MSPCAGAKAVSSWPRSMASQMTRSHGCEPSGTGGTPSYWGRSRGPTTVRRKCCGPCTVESGWAW